MGTLVNATTMCQCNYGAAPLPLSPSGANLLAENKPGLNVMDIPKGSFGICNSPFNPAAVAAKAVGATVPCSIAPAPPMWQPGSSTVLIRNMPALTNNSMMTCSLGGPTSIRIMPPGGAVKVIVK